MTNEQAKNMLKAKLECLKHETSGFYGDCNRCNCDECSLNYEQGNMGEQKKALEIAIKVLERQPCEDCISRKLLSDNICEGISCNECSFNEIDDESGCLLQKRLDELPSVQPKPKTDVLDKIRAEIHATAEMHEDGNYYLRDEWIDEIFDNYKAESEG